MKLQHKVLHLPRDYIRDPECPYQDKKELLGETTSTLCRRYYHAYLTDKFTELPLSSTLPYFSLSFFFTSQSEFLK